MPSTERTLLTELFSWGLLVSCSLGMLASALFLGHSPTETAWRWLAGTIVGGGREGCAPRNVLRWEKGLPMM